MIGLILVKELAMVDKAAHTPVSTLKMRSLPFLCATTPLYDLLHLFEVGRCHMAVLTRPLSPKDADSSLDIATDAPSAAGLQQQTANSGHAHWQQQQQQPPDGGQGEGHERCWQQRSDTSPECLISTEHNGMALDEVNCTSRLMLTLSSRFWQQCAERLVEARYTMQPLGRPQRDQTLLTGECRWPTGVCES